jgi:8-oxo-dGTP pyrophosphatase MutT (NUDIX family)
MEQLDELQYEKKPRAGLIPYIMGQDGRYRYLMMIASNSKFGGPRPMISKGKIEEGETPYIAAVREAEEELGLIAYNMKGTPALLTEEQVTLRSGTYFFTVYAVEIYDRSLFNMWCSETEYTEWYTLDEFQQHGRRDHIKFIQQLEQQLRQT